MSFADQLNSLDWDSEKFSLHGKTAADVERALARPQRDTEDFKALISPAARTYLEPMAQLSQQLTQQRFGRTQQLFAPLYLSNACANICTYCGFSMENRLRRKVLNADEIRREAVALKTRGFRHVLIVTGEAPKVVGVDYFAEALTELQRHFAQVSLEVQPLEQADYERLQALGLHSVLVYQETYHRPTYAEHHRRGNKADFGYRLDTMDRLGRAGIHRMGLGVLLGLTDWRTDSLMMAHHLRYLEQRYWRSRFSVSFPRLRPAAGDYQARAPISDADLVQLICAWRLFSPDVELSLSTRERAVFRDHLMTLGITSLSAESQTQPGGYSAEADAALEQFEIDDSRPLEDVLAAIRSNGYEPVFKDWQAGW
ncbi:MAG: 2-iminoacetate synthase ThiH [Natronospirillum sp.]|uniref:2-iminoacetate synthase ThiH n=1 Tax=Natronospirillum sp. TaxID=2812955 RepID=UPI0025F6B046|nr:2-iminoacetate synthase ThiH [Natronospirillum sp.]MCH8550523.1 2-iminoacetate synthase ThiH [Natronospirillum sp.]